MNMPFDLLIGRKTFDMWAPFWPKHSDIWPAVNTATKYVASNTMTSHEWQPSVFLNGDIAGKISKIKQQEGPDLHVYGSANLLQTLLKHDLVDGTDRTKMLGAVVGKALEPLRQGTAVIQVLVTLQ
jgi:dihydrofolate reductase